MCEGIDINTKIRAVVAVVVIVAAAGGAYLLMSDSSGSKEYSTDEYPSRLMVLGNANLDDYLDERDVAYLENIILLMPIT